MFDEEKLRAFGRLVAKLQQRRPLSQDETRDAFRQIWQNEQPELQQGAFLAALKSKGETRDELIGVAQSFHEEWTRHFPHVVRAPEPHLGFSGGGLFGLPTVNIKSGAAVVAAACGVYVHKIGAPALTGVSGSADAFTNWGVDADVPGAESVKVTERCRLGFTSLLGGAAAGSGVARVIRKLRIETSCHLAGPMASHVGERHKVMGVPAPPLVSLCCEVMHGLGYARAMVVCGGSREHPGSFIDELSTLGATDIAELTEDGSIHEFRLTPDEAGLPVARYADIAAASTPEENARIVARALAGKQPGPVLDILALNAAACLQLMGKVDDLATGVKRAREAVREGRAIQQLRALIEAQSADPKAGLAKLDALIAG
jgi:anthranilate phosphoribosyltransferase